jgi:hypothetical protein
MKTHALLTTIIAMASVPAFAQDSGQPNEWFIHYKESPPEDPKATYVWLGHIKQGYATRQDGPARSPEK